jgi:(5-formylfuran-3-yl)methyl phosphate synthase
MTPKLLVSVRSAAEAEEALAGGADLIDVKEPNLGSLGRASDAVVAEVVKLVAGRVPTSAALGELRDWDGTMPAGVDFVKAGLAGLARTDWRTGLDALRAGATGRAVIVAYADWGEAETPPLEDIVAYAENVRSPVLLIDTFEKRGPSLIDLIRIPSLAKHIARMRQANGRIALAGSLDPSTAMAAASIGPDWIAVRGAVCAAGRTGMVDGDCVRDLKRRLAGVASSGVAASRLSS